MYKINIKNNNNTNTNTNNVINKFDKFNKFDKNEKLIINKFLKEFIPNKNINLDNIHDFNWEYTLLENKVNEYFNKSKNNVSFEDKLLSIINDQDDNNSDLKNLDFCYKDFEYRKEINTNKFSISPEKNNLTNIPEKYNLIDKFNLKKYKDDDLENYYKILENNNIEFDNSIDFDELNKYGTNNSDIEALLSDTTLLNKYFKEILKYLKSYSYVEFNYFQLKVIYEVINIPDGYFHISDYVRSISKNIMSNDFEYFYSFYNLKTKKIFHEPYNNDLLYKKYLKCLSDSNCNFEKFNKNNILNDKNKKIQELKINVAKNEEYILEKYKLAIKCITRLNYKLSAKFGVTTTCVYTTYGKNDITFNGPVILYNIFEIINLIRIIYRIVPNSY